jgi:glucose-6-phosphate dehydrogenase assembly protein OpcA
VAPAVTGATTSPASIERQLQLLRGEAAGVEDGIRTHIVDLVAYADDPAVANEIGTAIAGLRHSRPSRALIVCGRPAATEVEATPSVFCAPMQEGGKSIVCSEVVRLDGPAGGDALASMAASLLLPDLPVFLLWLAPPDFERSVFRSLRTLTTRLVTDSTRFPETLDALGALIAQDREVVTDLAWTKITGWREVVASMFDDPAHRGALAELEHVAIDYVRGSDAQARLLGGWLVAGTGCDAVVSTTAVDRDDMRVGSLTRVAMDCGGKRYTVDRPQEGMAVIDAPGRATRHAALRVPPTPVLIGEELEFLTNDHAFHAALAAIAGRGG